MQIHVIQKRKSQKSKTKAEQLYVYVYIEKIMIQIATLTVITKHQYIIMIYGTWYILYDQLFLKE